MVAIAILAGIASTALVAYAVERHWRAKYNLAARMHAAAVADLAVVIRDRDHLRAMAKLRTRTHARGNTTEWN